MKKIKLLILAAFVCFGASINAQKIGHIDSQELVSIMPETKAAQDKVKAYAEELNKTAETMKKDYQSKMQEFTQNQDNYSPLIKQSKEKEIRGIIERIQEFEANAQKDLQVKSKDLFDPIRNKARKAISDVARKKGISYVLDKSAGALIFEGEGSVNLLDDVKKELGIK